MWMGTAPSLGELQNTTGAFSEAEPIRNADPVNVRLRGLNVTGAQDIGDDIDLVVVTEFQYANQPTVPRLHYMKSGASHGWYSDLFQSIVFTTRDFSHDDVTLRVHAYDRDHLDPETVDTVAGLAATVAPVAGFPHLAGYAKAAQSVSKTLTGLINSINENETIVDEQVRLEPGEEPDQGTDLLQPGYLVAVDGAASGESPRRLNQDTKLEDANGDVLASESYVVFEVEREHNEVEFSEEDQKAAKLAAELDGDGESTKDPLHYLRQTLAAYDKFDRIQRAEELQRLSEQEDVTLTDAERRLLGNLQADLETAMYLD